MHSGISNSHQPNLSVRVTSPQSLGSIESLRSDLKVFRLNIDGDNFSPVLRFNHGSYNPFVNLCPATSMFFFAEFWLYGHA